MPRRNRICVGATRSPWAASGGHAKWTREVDTARGINSSSLVTSVRAQLDQGDASPARRRPDCELCVRLPRRWTPKAGRAQSMNLADRSRDRNWRPEFKALSPSRPTQSTCATLETTLRRLCRALKRPLARTNSTLAPGFCPLSRPLSQHAASARSPPAGSGWRRISIGRPSGRWPCALIKRPSRQGAATAFFHLFRFPLDERN